LPTIVILKKEKADWESEFRHEIERYKERILLQGRVLPVYYGMGSDDETAGILFSDCGTALNERQDLEESRLRVMLREALTLLAESGMVHDNLTLSNILFDGRHLWIIDLEQTLDHTNNFNVEAEVSRIIYFYNFRQRKIREHSL
jgi:RIO1 family